MADFAFTVFKNQENLQSYVQLEVYYFASLMLSNVLTERFSILLFKMYFLIRAMTVH